MFSIFIIVMHLIFTGISIYMFDYRSDGVINNLSVVLLCIFLSLLATATIVLIIIEVFYILLPKDKIHKSMFVHKLATQIASVPFYFSGIRLKVTGLEHLPKQTGFTIYSNHNSWIDPTLIMNALYHYPVAALGKESTFKIPIIGKFAPKLGFVKIIREDPRQSVQAIKLLVKRVNDEYSMLIFPEGTRNPNYQSIHEFKAGAFKAALKSGRPLVPISLVRPKRKKYRFIKKIKVIIHKPLEYNDYKSLSSIELAKKVERIIGESLAS